MRRSWLGPLPPQSRYPTKSNIAGTGAATASFSVLAILPAKSKGASSRLPSHPRRASELSGNHARGPDSDVIQLGAARGADHCQDLAPAERVIPERAEHPARH